MRDGRDDKSEGPPLLPVSVLLSYSVTEAENVIQNGVDPKKFWSQHLGPQADGALQQTHQQDGTPKTYFKYDRSESFRSILLRAAAGGSASAPSSRPLTPPGATPHPNYLGDYPLLHFPIP